VPTAVVVGAGVGGLAVAGALARRDWNVTLLEGRDRLGGDHAGVLLWPVGIAALGRLGLAGGLDAIASPAVERGIRRPDGSWLVHPDESGARPVAPVVVRRTDLCDALVAGLGNRVDIRTGVRIRNVRVSATARPAVLDERTAWEADLVVGADGIDSTVRQRLAPEATVVPAGCTAWRATIPWYRATELVDRLDGRRSGEVRHRPDQRFGEIGEAFPGGETVGAAHRFRYALLGSSTQALSQRGLYWTATVPGAPRPESAEAQLTLLRRWFGDWHEPIGTLIAATAPDDLVQHEVGELWPMPRTFAFHAGSGGYALLGDAAHAMSHHLSIGACLALEDAAALVEAVESVNNAGGSGLRPALDRYATRRRREIVRIGRQSRRVGAALAATRTSVRQRDAALGYAPGPLGRASRALRSLRRP
jgi:2-polyprenyl-6-methoxyphenol hydroxylase-like FAD-dependent oxidoreductase